MKIAFIGGRDIHTLGGIESYTLHLATHLVRMGHTPVVYCESDRNEVEQVNGFRVIHQKSPRSKYICKFWLGIKATLKTLFREKDTDIYHYNWGAPAIISWLPRLCGKNVVLEGHGLEWKRTKYSSLQQKLLKLYESYVIGINNHLVMVSQEQSDYFSSTYHKPCVTIPTAVDIPDLSVESDVKERFGLEKDGYFLSLGRLVQEKNPDYIVKAYLASGITDKKLVIAGNNNQDKAYVESLHELAKGNPNVIFTGAVYGNDKEVLMRDCFCFCIPSTIEGLAITLLEAMSYGRIVIASDIPSNREGLGDNGIWCKYEDVDDLARQMRYVHANYASLQGLGGSNFERIKRQFTWDSVSQKYVDYLSSILR